VFKTADNALLSYSSKCHGFLLRHISLLGNLIQHREIDDDSGCCSTGFSCRWRLYADRDGIASDEATTGLKFTSQRSAATATTLINSKMTSRRRRRWRRWCRPTNPFPSNYYDGSYHVCGRRSYGAKLDGSYSL